MFFVLNISLIIIFVLVVKDNFWLSCLGFLIYGIRSVYIDDRNKLYDSLLIQLGYSAHSVVDDIIELYESKIDKIYKYTNNVIKSNDSRGFKNLCIEIQNMSDISTQKGILKQKIVENDSETQINTFYEYQSIKEIIVECFPDDDYFDICDREKLFKALDSCFDSVSLKVIKDAEKYIKKIKENSPYTLAQKIKQIYDTDYDNDNESDVNINLKSGKEVFEYILWSDSSVLDYFKQSKLDNKETKQIVKQLVNLSSARKNLSYDFEKYFFGYSRKTLQKNILISIMGLSFVFVLYKIIILAIQYPVEFLIFLTMGGLMTVMFIMLEIENKKLKLIIFTMIMLFLLSVIFFKKLY